MKLFHLSDLHIGKRVNDFSMLEEQEHILGEILDYVKVERPNGVIVAGDVYDKSVPSAEAVELFDRFLYELSENTENVFVISGNHDSPERIAFGGKLMQKSGVHLSPVYTGKVEPIETTDEYGEVDFYLLPFIKPHHVRNYFPDKEIDGYTTALDVAIKAMSIDEKKRNVLITHQFVTGASRSESEETYSVGGTDNVDGVVFSPFDYVALGHIHGPQNVGSNKIRYSGTPLKYSFSEAGHQKSVTVVELKEKGSLSVSTLPLSPLRDMRRIRGTFGELTSKDYYEKIARDDYLDITLTDEEDVPEALDRLRAIYKNVMHLGYDNTRTRTENEVGVAEAVEQKTPLELFEELFLLQNGKGFSAEQKKYLLELLEEKL